MDDLHRHVDCGVRVGRSVQLPLGSSNLGFERFDPLAELVEDFGDSLVLLVGLGAGKVLLGLIALRFHFAQCGPFLDDLLFNLIVILIGSS